MIVHETVIHQMTINDLFRHCYKLQSKAKLQKNQSKSDLIDKFNNSYRYLDDIFSVDNSDFYQNTIEIYPKKLFLNQANNNNTKYPFLDLYVSIYQTYTKINVKKDDFSF